MSAIDNALFSSRLSLMETRALAAQPHAVLAASVADGAEEIARLHNTNRQVVNELNVLVKENRRLAAAIQWALGEGDSDFGNNVSPRAGKYWWRQELRRRAQL